MADFGTRTRSLFWASLLLAMWPAFAHAKQQVKADTSASKDSPVVLEANQVGYDQDNAIVVAKGAVEVVQGATVLRADQLTYYQNQNVMRATGNVSVLQPSGDVYFAKSVELTENLKQGLVSQFRARLSDNSVFAAREATRYNEYQTRLKKAVYSPCKLCKGEDPFWQLKASKVDIDELDESVKYENARMELFGLPVFYTPYLSHPTPDADAKSGFMVPQYSQNSQYGTTVKVPYYWRMAPNHEATITSWYTSEDGPLVHTKYEGLLDNGHFYLDGSATDPNRYDENGVQQSGHQFRGHIFTKGNYWFADHWQAGFDINQSTDDTYLRRYAFSSDNVLFSRAFVEGAQGRNYALVQGLHIQGLRLTDDPDTTPLVLPTVAGYYETKPFRNGLRFYTEANAQYLSRNTGIDQQRVSNTVGATIPVVTDGGQVFTATANLRNDLYHLTDVTTATRTRPFTTDETRTIPQASLEWRYPLMRRVGNSSLTLEPVVLAVAQTTGNNPALISDEDNKLTELTDTNLFSINRFAGLDTIDSGSRLAYGVRGNYLMEGGDSVNGLFGQDYNVDTDSPFPNSTTQGKHFSDFIGRLAYVSSPFTMAYRFGLDENNFSSNRNELWTTFTHGRAYLQTAYLTVDGNQFIEASEEALVNAKLPIYAGWGLQGGVRRDLKLNQMVATQLGFLYENECFNILLNWSRSYTRDRDVEPSTTVSLQFGFKNLGEFGGR